MLLRFAAFILICSLGFSQGPVTTNQGANADLLDRGNAQGQNMSQKGPLPTATLANGMGTPGVTIGAIMTFAAAAPVGVFHGYFYAPGVDFPTSYFPFSVTGAYAWVGPPIFGSPIIGAGVAASPFTAMTGMWAGFTAVPLPAGVFSPGMIFGAKGIFGTAGIPVATGFGVCCGFDPAIAGPVLGGLTPGTGGGKPVVSFNPPGTMSALGPIAAPPATYVAGCFITGATVPVELQSFHIE